MAQLFVVEGSPYQLSSDCLTPGLLKVKAHYKDRPAAINEGLSQEDTL